jgi:transposase InsO family protein
MFDRIYLGSGIKHLTAKPYSPTTTGKAARPAGRCGPSSSGPRTAQFATLAQLQQALDVWVADDNTARPHQSCGAGPPIEQFRFADHSVNPGRLHCGARAR